MVYSPDTDVYNIGLPLVAENQSKRVIVQVNLPQAASSLYIDLNNMLTALALDPDLASLPQHKLPEIFQFLFICSGCDYISYFAKLGKAAFFNVFFQHATFITGGQIDGLLSDISQGRIEKGFLSFLRLIGTLYFKKHYAAIVSLRGIETPVQLFNAHAHSYHDIKTQHLIWYDDIRGIVSDRITSEEERMPSHTSMWRHWLRSCWVAHLWKNSPYADIFTSLSAPEHSGWLHQDDGSYTYEWECSQIQQRIKKQLTTL